MVASLLGAAAFLLASGCVRSQSGIGIGEAESGRTIEVAKGSIVRLVLPGDVNWTLESTNTRLLVVRDTMVLQTPEGPTRVWNFELTSTGAVTLRARSTCEPNRACSGEKTLIYNIVAK